MWRMYVGRSGLAMRSFTICGASSLLLAGARAFTVSPAGKNDVVVAVVVNVVVVVLLLLRFC